MADKVQVSRGVVWLGREVSGSSGYVWQQIGRLEKREHVAPKYLGYRRDGKFVFGSALRRLVLDALVAEVKAPA